MRNPKKEVTVGDIAVMIQGVRESAVKTNDRVEDLVLMMQGVKDDVVKTNDRVENLAIMMQGVKDDVVKTNDRIDDFAIMVQKGFEETNGRVDDVRSEVNGLKQELRNFREEEAGHFATVKNILYRNHDNRIEKIEDDIRILKTALKI